MPRIGMLDHRDGARTPRLCLGLSLIGSLVLLAGTLTGCSTPPGPQSSSDPSSAPSAGLEALASQAPPSADELAAILRQNALDLEALQKEQAARAAAPQPATPASAAPPAGPSSSDHSALAATDPTTPDGSSSPIAAAAAAAAPPAVTPEVAPPARTSDDHIRALTADLRIAIQQRLDQGSEVLPDYLALAALDVLGASAFNAEKFTTDNAAKPPAQRLSDRELRAVIAVREILDSLARNPDSAANPNTVSELFAKALTDLSDARTIRLPTTALCSRVESFGRYTPFAAGRFLAGQPSRVIIYAELENFGYRPARDTEAQAIGDQWAVEVSMELQLFHSEGSMLAWRSPAQRVVETSRTRRRDFYLAQMIELPRTLSIGPYTLKVVVRDAVGGGVAESIIPLEIVADPALTSAGAVR